MASVAAEHKLNWFGTARSRIGVLPTDSILLYATYGVAYGQVQSNYTLQRAAASRLARRN